MKSVPFGVENVILKALYCIEQVVKSFTFVVLGRLLCRLESKARASSRPLLTYCAMLAR